MNRKTKHIRIISHILPENRSVEEHKHSFEIYMSSELANKYVHRK